MATKAYLLVETAVGKTRDVASTLRELNGIETVDVVTGPYDIIAVISGGGQPGDRRNPHGAGSSSHGNLRGGRRLNPKTSAWPAIEELFSGIQIQRRR